MIKRVKHIFIFMLLAISFNANSCDGLNVTVVSNSYIGNGQYLLTIDICEQISNYSTLNGVPTDWATIYGIIITVNGANIVGNNTPSITGVTQGTVAPASQPFPNQIEYGDWGNPAAPIILDYGDPVECWTIELIVDNPAATVDVWASSSNSGVQPGAGMQMYSGSWGCGGGFAVPPITCNSDWTPPSLCVGSTTPIDLNTTTSVVGGTFTGTGVNSITGVFNPIGISTNTSVTFTVTFNGVTCSTTQDILFLNLVPPNLNDTTICPGDLAFLDATIAGVSGGCTYSVLLDDSYGDGWNGADLDIYINGVLFVSNATVPNCGGTPCQMTINIPVNNGDIILLNYSGGTWDTENTVTLFNSQGAIVSSVWDPPNGNLGSGVAAICASPVINYSWTPVLGLSNPLIANPTASPGSTTVYTVDISSPTLPCTTQATVTVTIGNCGGCIPPIILMDDQTVCSPLTVDLNLAINAGSGVGNATFYSTLADATAGINPINNIVTVSGTYFVRYEDLLDALCFSTASVNVTINPIYSSIENVSVCPGSNYTYPDGFTSTNINVAESHSSALLTTNGCDSTITTHVAVNAAFTSSEDVWLCTGSNHTYPDGTISNNVTVNESHVSAYVSVSGCDSLVTTNLFVNQDYNGVENVSACENSNVTYPDGVTQTITASLTHISALNTSNGCDSIIVTNVTMIPISNSVVPVTLCIGSNYTYPDGTVSTNIQVDESNTSTLISPFGCDSIIVTNITISTVITASENVSICPGENYMYPDGTVSNNIQVSELHVSQFVSVLGCDSLLTTNITVLPLPVINAGSDITICEGESIILTASGGFSYVWNNGVTNGVLFTPPSGSTSYTVTGESAQGCENTDEVIVTVSLGPEALFVGDTLSGCSPHTVTFTNLTANSANCVWDFGNGTTSNNCGPITITYDFAGLYDVSLTVTDINGCTDTETITDYILVEDAPIAGFSVDDMTLDIYDTEVHFFNSTFNGTSYIWDFGDNSTNSTDENTIHSFPSEVANYVVTLYAMNDAGCKDSISMVISLDDVLIFYVPNSFTPDGDDYNELFKPVFTSGYDPFDFDLYIFNRWGEVIWESHDVTVGWDGTYGVGGREVQDGTYTWKMEFKETMTDKRHTYTGHVSKIK